MDQRSIADRPLTVGEAVATFIAVVIGAFPTALALRYNGVTAALTGQTRPLPGLSWWQFGLLGSAAAALVGGVILIGAVREIRPAAADHGGEDPVRP